MKLRVLVTGGAGFVGTNLIKRLLADGHSVISIDNYHTGLKENHQYGCKYLNHDLRNLKEFPIVDVVFHLAAIARIQPSFNAPKDYFTTNANGTLNLVDWCVRHDIPIVYAGSSSKHSGRFKNPYTFTKDVGEDIIKLYQEHFNLKASIARFYNVYGPHQLTEGGYCTVVGIWLKAFKEGKKLQVTGDGEQRRDFTHVDDIVDALVRINAKQVWGEDFELGKGKNYSLNELIKLIKVTPEYIEERPGEARETLNTDQTAKNILDWHPIHNIEDYIEEEFI